MIYLVKSSLSSDTAINKWVTLFRNIQQAVEATILKETAANDIKHIIRRGSSGGLTRRIDEIAESIIIGFLESAGIEGQMLSEEAGILQFGKSNNNWLFLDPIDGTINAVQGIPFYNMSICVGDGPTLSDTKITFIHNFATNTEYLGIRGRGAFRNKIPVSPSSRTQLNGGVIGARMSTHDWQTIWPRIYKRATRNQKIQDHLIDNKIHIRQLGAISEEICFSGVGVYDAYIDLRGTLRLQDVTPALAFVDIAGCMITDINYCIAEEPILPNSTSSLIISGNPTLHKHLLEGINLDIP